MAEALLSRTRTLPGPGPPPVLRKAVLRDSWQPCARGERREREKKLLRRVCSGRSLPAASRREALAPAAVLKQQSFLPDGDSGVTRGTPLSLGSWPGVTPEAHGQNGCAAACTCAWGFGETRLLSLLCNRHNQNTHEGDREAGTPLQGQQRRGLNREPRACLQVLRSPC